jgi:hypothetical protein
MGVLIGTEKAKYPWTPKSFLYFEDQADLYSLSGQLRDFKIEM